MRSLPFALSAQAAVAGLLLFSSAHACSTCGCTLNSDWASQGFRGGTGWLFDLRFDYFDQDRLRSGRHRVDPDDLVFPNEDEVQRRTTNRNTTLTIDDGIDEDWGLTVQLPYLDRSHKTIDEGEVDVSSSHSASIGDLRVMGRYQGLTAARDIGLQFGLKLPTGRTGVDFNAGPTEGERVDAGLQPGTGSTDALLGAYTFGSIGRHADWFAQALLQIPLHHKDDYRPGNAANVSAGVRYLGFGEIVPQLQFNVRTEKRESGESADVPNSGATLAYLSPGVTWAAGEAVSVYGFVQLPVYQRVNGLQIEPRYSVSAGIRYAW